MTPTKMIVIGASAGGVEAITQLLRNLPASLNASIFIVLHIPSHGPSLLPQIFGRYTILPVINPQNMEHIEVGKVYIAPPDYHLLIKNGYIKLSKDAKVNNSRPSIDNLFISAALSYKEQVIGIILTGLLDDGSVGLAKIKRYGGITIVQDPAEATYPQMPMNAIKATNSDYILPLSQISDLLIHLVEEPIKQSLNMSEQELNKSDNPHNFPPSDQFNNGENVYHRGRPSVYSCPECGGVLAEVNDGDILRYICRVGHTYSSDWLLVSQKENIEKALWTALRALDESISLARNTAEQQRDEALKQEFLEKADEYEKQATVLRSLLFS